MFCLVEFKQWKQLYSLSCPWYIYFVLSLTLHCWRLNYIVLYGHCWKLRKSLRCLHACRGAGWVDDQQVVVGFLHSWSVHLALMLMKKTQKQSNCHDPKDISWLTSLVWQIIRRIPHYTPCPDLDGTFGCFTCRKYSTIPASHFSLRCNEINHFYCTRVLHTNNFVKMVQLVSEFWDQCHQMFPKFYVILCFDDD